MFELDFVSSTQLDLANRLKLVLSSKSKDNPKTRLASQIRDSPTTIYSNYYNFVETSKMGTTYTPNAKSSIELSSEDVNFSSVTSSMAWAQSKFLDL